jgi:hypothetical protein
MSQIIAWKCDYTGKVFEDEHKYIKHARKQSLIISAHKERLFYSRAFNKTVHEMHQLTSIKSIEEFIQEHWKVFYYKGIDINHDPSGNLGPITFSKLKSIKLDVTYNSNVSNSHSCPLNGVTNHSRQDLSKPSSYPGWSGRIAFVIESSTKHRISASYFKQSGINTGTGSVSNSEITKQTNTSQHRYDVKMFADDFKALAYKEEVHRTFKALQD